MTGPFESVSPLPAEVRRGLIAMACIGLTSLLTTFLLFSHITYKLVQWKIRDVRNQTKKVAVPAPKEGSIDLSLGLAEDHYYRTKIKLGDSNSAEASTAQQELQEIDTKKSCGDEPSPGPVASTRLEKPPNPLLLLIYNLLLADITLSMSYVSNVAWLAMDGIIVPSTTCSFQGWTVSFGCLTTSGFLLAISIFSYFGIIRGYKATTRDVIIASSTVWSLALIIASLGPMYFHNSISGYYGRENTWCWISEEHRLWRSTIYVWGFPTMAATMCIYSVIFYKLWREGRSSRFMPRRRGSNSTAISLSQTSTRKESSRTHSTALRPSGHHPAFLIYPCIYGFTGTPLILGSLIPALERNPLFMSTAGSLLALTGLLDTILWSSIILFGKCEDLANTGLDQFSFMRTPEGRMLGNIVFVQGGDQGNEGKDRRLQRQSWHSRKEKGWWKLGDRNSSPSPMSRAWPPDREAGNQGIQMEVVTTVVVESGAEDSRSHTRNMSRQPQMS